MANKQQQITALAYDKRGKLLAVGRNSYTKTHPLQSKYANLSKRPAAIYLHAELDALIKARQQVHKLVVIRVNSKGKPVIAKPCPSCQLAIRDFNVKHVTHT